MDEPGLSRQAPEAVPDAVALALQTLQTQFLARLPARLDDVRALWHTLSSGAWSVSQAEVLHRAVHSLTGTSGTFGLHELSRAARQFEHLLHQALQSGPAVGASDWAAMRLAQERLQAASLAPAPAAAAPAGVPALAPAASPPMLAWRVLVVDDDPMALEAHACILQAAGMVVHRVRTASDTVQAVSDFEPDVVLLDVYMPGASGPEVAAALREREDWLHLSILFLSAETDLTQQLLALDLGGDDFLIKPVQAAHLVAAVSARARRSRHNRNVQNRLQTTLYEREREHLALNQHAIVSMANVDGNITYANERFYEISGFTREEVIGRNHRIIKSGAHPPEFYAELWSEITNGRVWQGEICSRHKDGSLYWVAATITPFMDGQGLPYQYVSIRTDITHIKETQAELRRQRDMQRVIGKAAARMVGAAPDEIQPAILAALRASGEQMGAGRAYLFLFSRDGERVSGLLGWDAPGLAPLLSQDVNRPSPEQERDQPWIKHDTPWMLQQFMGENLLRIGDVRQLPASAASDRAFLQSLGVTALVAVPMLVRDRLAGFIAYGCTRARTDWLAPEVELLKVLSEVIGSALARRRAERALRESEARLHFLVSASPVTIYTCQAIPPYTSTYISPNLTRLMGHEPELVMKTPGFWHEHIHPEDRAGVRQQAAQLFQQGVQQQEYRFRARDGRYLWVHDQQRLLRDAAGTPTEIIGYWMDITERKRIEDELSRFNDELEHRVADQTRSVIESERMARATLDALSARVVILDEQGVVLAANRAWTLTQPSAADSATEVGERSNYLSYCDRLAESGARLEAGPIAQGVRAVIAGEKSEFLHEYTVFSGPEQHWYVCRVERFPGDGAVRVVVSHDNVTQMKQIERQQMRSQRLESLGTLAGGVAHDLNNALAPILMGMDMLKEDHPGEAKVLDMIQASARRGADMVKQLLAFAKGANGERVALQSVRLVHELETMMRGSFPKNIQVVVDCDPLLPGVMGDPTQLHQVLLNLCVNARDAMPLGGTLTLHAQWVDVDATYARLTPEARPGRYVVLRVSDTGTGIPPDIVERIFDPFFTTKSLDKGTGLGLSTVLGIIKGHQGFVQVYSQPGEGSTFAVYLPAHQLAPVDALPAPLDQAPFRGAGEVVLFVDDEAAVREVGQAVLTRLNLKALMATDGADGLVQAALHQQALRVVVTDLHMPHMDGLSFVRALRRTLPRLPVIVCSGRVDDAVAAEFRALGVSVRLDKPFSEAQLSQALQKVLHGPPD